MRTKLLSKERCLSAELPQVGQFTLCTEAIDEAVFFATELTAEPAIEDDFLAPPTRDSKKDVAGLSIVFITQI